MLLHDLKCNFPMNPHVRLLVGLLAGRVVGQGVNLHSNGALLGGGRVRLLKYFIKIIIHVLYMYYHLFHKAYCRLIG